ncbi:MAG: hypothetical protein P1U84_17560 [Parvibaculaceae bacterium]|nr:hypothetical protein [Parvibaculaceae bacterium]
MGSASLNISVVEKRMYRPSEAAAYCGLALKHFKDLCPVPLVELREGVELFDKHDLDRWIDSVKDGAVPQSQDDILRRLA